MIKYRNKVYASVAEISSAYGVQKVSVYKWIQDSKIDILDIPKFCEIVLQGCLAPSDLRGTVYVDLDSVEELIGWGKEHRPKIFE